jgi:hypothetical protein
MLKKILFACSMISFVIGFNDLGKAPQWDLGRPLGAVLFILFLIVTLLEKETALYDLQESGKSTLSHSDESPVVRAGRPTFPAVAHPDIQ